MSDVTVRAIGNGTTVLPSTAESVSLRIAAPTRSIQLAVVPKYIGATPAAPSVYEVLSQSAHECTESLSTASLPCNLNVGQPATGNVTYQYAYLPARPPGGCLCAHATDSEDLAWLSARMLCCDSTPMQQTDEAATH